MKKVILSAVAVLLSSAALHSADPPASQNWPQWRGPASTGAASVANPPTTWNDTTNIKWKVKAPGVGSATPIVWDRFVFIQTAVSTGKTVEAAAHSNPAVEPVLGFQQQPNQQPAQRRGGGRGGAGGGFGGGAKPTEVHQFILLCLDRQTGKTLWQKTAREEVPHEGHHRSDGTFASSSPVTDGKHVYAFFGSRGLHCFDMDGNLKWQKDLGRMQTKNSFGEGSSPALHGNTLVVLWDHEGDDFIIAFDKTTGNELWRQPRNEETTWSTPLIVEHEGKAQVITAATRKVRSYDLATGTQIWEYDGLTANVIPSPVAADGIVYLMSGFRGSKLAAIKLGKTGNLAGTDAVLWTHHRSTPYVPSPVLSGNRLYFFSSNNAILSCFDAKTGKPLIDTQRIEDLQNVYASPVAAGGKVYLVGRNGVTVVIKDSDKLEVLATNKLNDRIDASPAVAGNELFLRGREHLYCIAEK